MGKLFSILLLIFYCSVLNAQACPVFPKPLKKQKIKLEKIKEEKKEKKHGHYLFIGFGYYSTLGKVETTRKEEQLNLGGRAFIPSFTYHNRAYQFTITLGTGYDFGFQEPVIYGSLGYRIFPFVD